MRLIEELKVKPLIEPSEYYHHKRILVRDYPLFSKRDSVSSVAGYVLMMPQEGHDMSNFNYSDLPGEGVDCSVGKRKRSSNASKPEKKNKNKKKKKKKSNFLKDVVLGHETSVATSKSVVDTSIPVSLSVSKIIDAVSSIPTTITQTSLFVPPSTINTSIFVPVVNIPTILNTTTIEIHVTSNKSFPHQNQSSLNPP